MGTVTAELIDEVAPFPNRTVTGSQTVGDSLHSAAMAELNNEMLAPVSTRPDSRRCLMVIGVKRSFAGEVPTLQTRCPADRATVGCCGLVARFAADAAEKDGLSGV